MAFEPGGYADKLGNRHEGRWVVKQLLRLLDEQIASVVIEAVGDDQQGVDLVVETKAGERQFQQCKARNAGREYWTVGDLNSRHILSNMRFQLDRDSKYEFALVTGVPASVFGDICESARNSSGDSETYYRYQIQEVGEDRRETFRRFCECLGLRDSDLVDRSKAFDYLRRTRVTLWPDDQNSYHDLIDFAGLLVDGEPENVIACLAQYAVDNLRKRLAASDIWKVLQESGYNPRRLVHDDRVAPAIEELRRQFEESIAPGLIGGRLIAREETQLLLKALDQGNTAILHGVAGCGKSGVLYELVKILKNKGITCLPVRLDRQQPNNTPREFGTSLGLPESPTWCLKSQFGETTPVLILDQLDALRWTSSHSVNSLTVCKALVREAASLRSNGRPVSVVLSCRTFDLEHDPEIKSWLESQNPEVMRYTKIEVKGLSSDVIERVVTKSGGDFGRFTQRQKDILASPQHLAMWVTIAQQGHASDFRSSTELMRQFWANRYQHLAKAGVDSKDADKVLDRLVGYMEVNGRLSAPATLISHEQKVVHELHTLEIIRTQNTQVSFCHQSYLDFRIADQLVRDIHQRTGTVTDWLGSKEKQSLFRREQLRQVLLLLCDEAPEEFLKTVKELLRSIDVRFHLKHLFLEIIAQITEPSQSLCEYVLELWREEYWHSHISETVLPGQAQYIKFLIGQGVLSNLFDGTDEKERNIVVWLLRSVAGKIPDAVTGLLDPYMSRGGDWPQLILRSLSWSCEDDSDAMFELRLRLARMGIVRDFVNWKKLASTNPVRVPKLIEAVISTWDTPSLKDNSLSNRSRQCRLEQWTAEDLQALKMVARDHPLETWNLLMPHVERLTAIQSDEYGNSLKDWLLGDEFGQDDAGASISRGIVELLCESGKRMASDHSATFVQNARGLRNSVSRVTQEILVFSYGALPPQFSDEAISWLLADTSRFRLGAGYNEHEWMPAVRLIEAQSPHCSEALLRALETAIIYYHSPDEIEEAQYLLSRRKEGYLGDYWGRTQYFLLPALCHLRRSEEVHDLIGVLERRFAGYPEKWFLRGGWTTGGCVGSPIPSERLHKISDKAWLGIVGSKKIAEGRTSKWKQIGPNRVAESSAMHFADDLRVMARRCPERFARLALKFPPGVHPFYIAAILDGIKATKPDEVPEQDKASWKPAETQTIEAVFEKCRLGDDQSVAHNFCWLIRARPTENWSQKTVARLLDYVTSHPDPESGKLNVYRTDQPDSKWTVDDLIQNAINCVRGVAALAIGAILWEHPDWVEKLKLGLEHLAGDPHPAVRVAAIEACLPLLNIDRDLAVDLFLKATEEDLRVAACPYAVYYFNYCMQSHTDKLSPLIVRMFNSGIGEVAEKGAGEVCARWVFYEFFDDELNKAMGGSIPQRKGIADMAASLMAKNEYREKCKGLLIRLADDPDENVRQRASHAVYHKPELLEWPAVKPFLLQFVHTQAFRDDPTGTLLTFEEYPGSLIQFAEVAFAICEGFAGPLAELSRDISTSLSYDASKIPSLLLRLYDQAERGRPDIAQKCLDAWDILFENRIGPTRDLTKAIER